MKVVGFGSRMVDLYIGGDSRIFMLRERRPHVQSWEAKSVFGKGVGRTYG
jgi:hypothetical protein